MKKSYTIAGVGVCLGKRPGYEMLAQSAIVGQPIAGAERTDSLELAIREAMQFSDFKELPILTDTLVPELKGQTLCGSFPEMLREAPENALLLSHRENGWLALALTQQEKGFAQVRITDDAPAGEDDLRGFILCALEIRFALRLDDRDTPYRFWDSAAERSKQLYCGGLLCDIRDPKAPASKIHTARKVLLPIVFTTVEEAVQKLTGLRSESSLGGAMARLLPELQKRNEHTNTIVLLADSLNTLAADVDDLLKHSRELLDDGFTWKRPSGSRYIRRSWEKPQIVFMNPPASMFNDKAFYQLYFNIFGTMQELNHFETHKMLTADKDIFFSDYLFDITVTHLVTNLLENIGIRPDILSGASMGEMANLLRFLEYADGTPSEIGAPLRYITEPLAFMMRGDDEPLNNYLGRKTDGFTKFYVKGDAGIIRKAAEKYDSVFVMIVGSTEDVILTGERSALRRLVAELGCLANELNVANYIHTPVVAHLADQFRSGLMATDLRLAKLDYTIFSSQFLGPMDNTVEMMAENTTRLVTQTVDYAAAVNKLYENGGRVFIDLSTNQMCGTWAGNTLKGRSDAVIASLYANTDPAEMLLNLCAGLLASNVSFEHQKLLSRLSFPADPVSRATPMKKEVSSMAKTTAPAVPGVKTPMTGDEFAQVIQKQILNNEKAFRMFMDAQNKLYAQMVGTPAVTAPAAGKTKFPDASKTCLYDREQVITMTDTSMSAVLGPQYAEVDQYPVRARMPLPPFLFVSRIMSIDAEYGVFRPSSIVTEFDLDEDCVFLCSDRTICPLVASEASHIAIFLIAYMGLDAISKGTLSYRAIDSSMTSYSERPFRVGDTLKTVLKINRFVKNGSTTLLFFNFESYNGDELISVTEATGGFFTRADLESNKGIIRPKLQMRKAVEPKEFIHFSDTTKTTYEKHELDAFYRGDYESCFGVKPKPTQKELYYLPYDLKMVDRVTEIDYNGGVYGRGIICGEKQITPDMWPFKAHFKNDPVFPAIITSDGVTQLGMFLFAHAGLLNKFDNATFTTIKGNCCNSRFRGQVRHGYSKLRYEISVREVVEDEDSICVYLDAAIFNDDVQIMQIDSYSMRITNADK